MDNKAIQQIKQRYSIVGNYEGLNRCLDIAVQVAPTELAVLICGESGVGKEVLPRVIHDNSTRKHNKYFAINCGSLPEGTIDSELFGHKKGAFTGALEDRDGYFGVANNGTLFLDEVGELPMATQARLLRVLETGEYIRVGESEVRKTNVRIVAATNVNMQKAIREGKFREDLYYRLNTIPIIIPPLRERGRDIELLFRKFAYDMAEKYHNEPVRLSEDAASLLLKYKWPGNIRQLRNIVERLSVLNQERIVTAETLKGYGITDDSLMEPGLVVSSQKNDYTGGAHSYEKERDMLFQLLSSIGKEVQDLKAIVHDKLNGGMNVGLNTATIDVYRGGNTQTYDNADNAYEARAFDNGRQAFEAHQFNHSGQAYEPRHFDNGGQAYEPHPFNNAGQAYDAHHTYEGGNPFRGNDIQDVIPMPVEEVKNEPSSPLSNEELMKQNIINSLKRNNGNRKMAAKELGLSERTVYRKIKQYGLDI